MLARGNDLTVIAGEVSLFLPFDFGNANRTGGDRSPHSVEVGRTDGFRVDDGPGLGVEHVLTYKGLARLVKVSIPSAVFTPSAYS